MSQIRIKPTAAVDLAHGGYIARTMSKSFLASAPITAWTQFYHKPYSTDDWKEAKAKAKDRCLRKSIDQDSVIIPKEA